MPVTGEGFFLGKKMTGEEKEGGSTVQGYPLLQTEFEANPGDTRLSQNNNDINKYYK